MLADLQFHLSWLLMSSCVFSGSGGTETELADLGCPRTRPGPQRASPDTNAVELFSQLFPDGIQMTGELLADLEQ